ncbi:hypothetical protein PO909_031873 [Leuciscus waleckii]
MQLCPKTASTWRGNPTLPSSACRFSSSLTGKAYSACGEAASALHAMALLQVHQAKALSDMQEGGTDPGVLQELRTATDVTLWATKVTARSLGRAVSTLVVQERHVWLTLADMKESDKSKFLNSPISHRVAEEPTLGYGGVQELTLVKLLHISQGEPQVSLLEARPRERAVTFEVRRRTQLLQHPWVCTTLLHVTERFGLVDLEKRHGMQGRSSFSTHTISLSSQTGREPTGAGGEHGVTPPGGRSCIATDRSTGGMPSYPFTAPLSRLVREEEGVDLCRAARPRSRHLVMHLRKEWHWGGVLRTSTARPEIPIVEPRGFGTQWRNPHKPNTSGRPGKHSGHFRVQLGQRYHTQRGQRSRVVIPRR